MSHLHEEIRRHPLHVGIGGLITGQVAKPAPTAPGDAVRVTIPAFNPTMSDNPNPARHAFDVVAWRPHYTVAVDHTVTAVYPAAGDACLLAVDSNGQLWLLDWTTGYQWPASDEVAT
jgi:hypothetical protein